MHRASEDEHYVGVAVVGAAVAVFSGRAAEFGHGYYYRVFSQIAEVGPESGDRLREIAEHVGDLALGAAFVDVVVPASYVGEGYLHSEVRFDQLRQLLQAVAEASLGIICVGRGRVVRGVGGFQHLDRVESFLPGAVQDGVHGVVVHGFEGVRHGRGVGILSSDGKIVEVVDRDRRLFAGENARQRRAERDGAEGGLSFLRFAARLPGRSRRARFSQPSSVTFTPGVPDSMKSCASKCERVGSGDPAACTMARCFCFQSGSNDAIAGCNPKKPSRSSTDFFGMLMVGRMA